MRKFLSIISRVFNPENTLLEFLGLILWTLCVIGLFGYVVFLVSLLQFER